MRRWLGLVLVFACRREPAVPIAVSIDGHAEPAIDAARLRATQPASERIWTLASLLGARFTRPNTRLEIVDAVGETLRIRDPVVGKNGRELALLLGKDGKPRIAWWKRGEAHDAGARKAPVRELRLSIAPPEPEPPPPPIEVAVIVDGKTRAPLHADDLGPLREVVRRIAGAHAAAITIEGEDSPLKIPPREWRDPNRIPVLRLNRRHQVRFQWFGKHGEILDLPGVRDVRSITIYSVIE